MIISIKDCILLAKLFYKNNDCETVALQKLRTVKGKKGFDLMHTVGLGKMILKFEKTGSFDVQSGRIGSMSVEKLAGTVQE